MKLLLDQMKRRLNQTNNRGFIKLIKLLGVVIFVGVLINELNLFYEQREIYKRNNKVSVKVLEIYCSRLKSSLMIVEFKNRNYKVSPYRDVCYNMREGMQIELFYNEKMDSLFFVGMLKRRVSHIIFLLVIILIVIFSPNAWFLLK